jgi:glycosyltransferase involved in cell wall biosynthesis
MWAGEPDSEYKNNFPAKKMRIAVVINTSWNIFNFRRGLIQNFLDNGHEVFAIAPPDDYSLRLVEMGCRYVPVELDNKGSQPHKDIFFLWNLLRIYRHIRPDVILHYTIKPNVYGTLAAAALGIPSVNNVSGLGTVFLRKNFTNYIALGLYRLAFRFPKTVFFQNQQDRKLFVEKKLIAEKITDVLPGSGIDLNHFKPAGFVQNETFTFLLIARLLREKGILEYVEAGRKLRQQGLKVRLQLLGFLDHSPQGITEAELDGWVKAGEVEYLGRTDDVRPCIYAADCVVLPSYREGTPRSLLEAASLAKPIITTNVPGCTEVVQDKINGYLCEVKNPDDLAQKMQQMMSLPPQDLQKMGNESRRMVESRFDEKEVIRQYNEVLGKMFNAPQVFRIPVVLNHTEPTAVYGS